jgi:DNA-binding transcriptional MocR family regulator
MGFQFHIDRDLAQPVHRQLRRQLTEAINRREIAPGQYLPSTRGLAASAGINRLTALKAFQALQRAGLVQAKPGRGYFVVSRRADASPLLDQDRDLVGVPAKHRASFEAAYSETVDSASHVPLSFAAGYPDASLMPLKQLRQLFARWTNKFAGNDFEYQPPGGHPHLREQLWIYLAARGVEPGHDRELLVTNGAQHALDLFARSLKPRSGRAAVESPTYYGALAAFEINGFEVASVPQDAHGLSISILDSMCKDRSFDFLYTNPSYNNPTGLTLTRDRRKALVKLAERRSLLVLEDDTYADLGFTGANTPSLISLDPGSNICQIGSFSKSFIPGLRMGFIVGPKSSIENMVNTHGVNDMCSSTLSQLVLADALASGLYERHVRAMRKVYRKRCRIMEQALLTYLPEACRFDTPKGGFFFWIRLPGVMDSTELKDMCNRDGIDFADGPHFSADTLGANYIRLNFTLLDEDAIEKGIKILGMNIRNLM